MSKLVCSKSEARETKFWIFFPRPLATSLFGGFSLFWSLYAGFKPCQPRCRQPRFFATTHTSASQANRSIGVWNDQRLSRDQASVRFDDMGASAGASGCPQWPRSYGFAGRLIEATDCFLSPPQRPLFVVARYSHVYCLFKKVNNRHGQKYFLQVYLSEVFVY